MTLTTFTSTTVESTTISGSTSTGSFGRVETVGNSNLSGQLDVGGKVVLSREPIQGFNYLQDKTEGEVSSNVTIATFISCF